MNFLLLRSTLLQIIRPMKVTMPTVILIAWIKRSFETNEPKKPNKKAPEKVGSKKESPIALYHFLSHK